MTLAELHNYLTTSQDLQELLKAVADEFHQRNLTPLSGVNTYSGNIVEGDPFTADYAKLKLLVHGKLAETDMTTRGSINDKDTYGRFRLALWFGDEDGKDNIDRSLPMVLAYLLERYTPDIDDYVAAIDDTALAKRLGLHTDDEGLIELKDSMELRKHALVLPDQDTMIYPHQFLRRFYSANFVNTATILEHCRKQGYKIQLRIDPLRVTKPRFYRELVEADYWYGPKFDNSMLLSKDKKPVRTLHYTNPDDKMQNLTYPLDFTLFRSDMMSAHERQYTVEEYVPLINPALPTHRVPGVGESYVIQKFGHFVYDQNKGHVSHVDGAIRVFEKDEYADVLSSVAKGSEPGKRVGKRHKLFKVTGALDLELVQAILYEYFRYNPHLGEYFATKEENLAYAKG